MNEDQDSKSDASDHEIKKYQSIFESLDKTGRTPLGNPNAVKKDINLYIYDTKLFCKKIL